MLTLFYAPGTCALASFIALEETGLDYDVRILDLANGAQRSTDYLAVNPKGRVPALATERGNPATETPAILSYLAQIAPDARLAPLHDPFAFAQLQAFNAFLCSTVHVAHAHGRRGARWADQPASHDDMKRKVPETMTAACRLIEDHMLAGPWVMGEDFSIADPYLYTITTWLPGDGVDLADFPKLGHFKARMEERPAVRKVLGGL